MEAKKQEKKAAKEAELEAKKQEKKAAKEAELEAKKQEKKAAKDAEKKAKKEENKTAKDAEKKAKKEENKTAKDAEKKAEIKSEIKTTPVLETKEEDIINEEQEEDECTKFIYEGTEYIKSIKYNIIYNLDEEDVGRYNETTKKIEFYEEEFEEEEYDK